MLSIAATELEVDAADLANPASMMDVNHKPPRVLGATLAIFTDKTMDLAADGSFRVTLGGEIVYGARQPMVRIGTAAVALPAGAFLQAVPQAERVMADFAVAAVDGASRVADLYCGVGSFALRLAEQAGVWAADSSDRKSVV